jgi:hypothetical protein
MNEKSQEAAERTRGRSDGIVFPFINVLCEAYHNFKKKLRSKIPGR